MRNQPFSLHQRYAGVTHLLAQHTHTKTDREREGERKRERERERERATDARWMAWCARYRELELLKRCGIRSLCIAQLSIVQ